MEASDSTTHIFISSALEQFASDQAAEKTIEYWENGILDFHEMFVCTLQEIGSKLGYDYLSEVEDRSAPDYLWETLIILGTVHGEKPAKLKEYKKILQEKNDAKSSQDPFEAFVQKYETKTGESSADMDNDEEYTRNSDGTIIRTEEKVGRNDPCPCGSGKKYKKCCGR
jgi:hypothetical protein